jgi:MscS family membrane protein
MKNIRYLLYILAWGAYFYFLYFYFGIENIVNYSEKVFITQVSLSYISGLVAFFTLFGLISFLEKIIQGFAKKITEKTETDLDDLVLDLLFSSIHTVKYLFTFYIAWQVVESPESLNAWISECSSILLLIILLLFVTKLINLLFNHKLIDESKMKAVSRTLMPFVRKTIVAIVWIVGIITIISNLGYDVTALIAWAWVGGIAVALAAQKSIANIFGAITILMNKPFTLWDYVTINGHTGTVKDIWLSYITLIDRLWHNVMIPNENIISTSIENESRRNYRRADFSIGLIYDTTLPQMQKWVKMIEDILESYVGEKSLQSYRVNFEAFGDFSLNINVTYFSNTKVYNQFVKEKEEVNLEIKKQFGKAKLEMAFPTTEMIIKNWEIK